VENQSSPSGLTGIVMSVATKLMAVTANTAADISTGTLAELVAILGVDASFLCYNDHSIRATVLVAEWPRRLDKRNPDPLHTVYLADADLIFALAEHAKEPVVFRPGSQTRVTNAQFRRQAAFRPFPGARPAVIR
jgi:hypothetical protein